MNNETRVNILKITELINKGCTCTNCINSVLTIENSKIKIICKIHDAYVSDDLPCLDYSKK